MAGAVLAGRPVPGAQWAYRQNDAFRIEIVRREAAANGHGDHHARPGACLIGFALDSDRLNRDW